MSTNTRRASILAASAGTLVLLSGAASAQTDQRTAVNILFECSKITDSAARLACYDNNVRNIDPGSFQAAPVARSAPPVPGPVIVPGAAVAATQAATGPQGFGFESVREEQRRVVEQRPPEQKMLTTTVSSARQREPGRYLVVLDDGAQWVFTESVDFSFRPPRSGQTIEIERSSLDGYLMRIDGQEAVPVRRIR